MAKNEDKAAEQEDQEPKKKKKKVKKVDIAQNLLFAILGTIMGLVAVIGICAMNPELTDMVSEMLVAANEAEKENTPVSDTSPFAATTYEFDLAKFQPSEDGAGTEGDTSQSGADGATSDSDSGNGGSAGADVAQNTNNSGIGTETTEVANTENADGGGAEAETNQVENTDNGSGDGNDSANTASGVSTNGQSSGGNQASDSGSNGSQASTAREDSNQSTDSQSDDSDSLVDAITDEVVTPLVTITSDDTTEVLPASDMEEFTYDPEIVTDRSSMQELNPDVIELPSKKQADQIANNTGYGDTGEGLDFNADYYPYYNMLDDKGKALYRQIYANAMALNTSFKPVQQASMKELRNAIESVTYDHPELFWLDTTFYTEYDWDGTAVKLELSFYSSLGDINPARNAFEANVERMIEPAKNFSSDYDKEKYVHDLLADKLTYKRNPLDQSAYSAIVGDKTVCAGYAKAFQYLMQKLGVPTYLCVGAGAFQLHAWNVTRLNGNYYNVDCTWDDQDPTIYDYFNLPDSINLMHTRMYQSVNLPACSDFSLVGGG